MIKRELGKAANGLHISGIRFSAPVQMRVDFIHARREAVRWREPVCELYKRSFLWELRD